ncbi:MAG: hypothetical protein ACKO37_01795 [Vampirovibrionales bacterium]
MMTGISNPVGLDPTLQALLLQAGQTALSPSQPAPIDPNLQALFQTYFPSAVPAMGTDPTLFQAGYNPQAFLQGQVNTQPPQQFGAVTFNTNQPTLAMNQDLANNKAFTTNQQLQQGLTTGTTPSTGAESTAVAGTRATVLGRFQPSSTGATLAANYGVGNANPNGTINALIPGADGRYGNDSALLKSSMSSLLAPLQSVLQATQANTTTGKQLIQQGQATLQQQQFNKQLLAMYPKQQEKLEDLNTPPQQEKTETRTPT